VKFLIGNGTIQFCDVFSRKTAIKTRGSFFGSCARSVRSSAPGSQTDDPIWQIETTRHIALNALAKKSQG
jgi:hypothetical protein